MMEKCGLIDGHFPSNLPFYMFGLSHIHIFDKSKPALRNRMKFYCSKGFGNLFNAYNAKPQKESGYYPSMHQIFHHLPFNYYQPKTFVEYKFIIFQ